jgi:hypothetical protein
MFGSAMPRLVPTKQIFGEYAAGGALQLAAALLSVEESSGLRNVLVNSLSAGGGIVSAVVSRDAA